METSRFGALWRAAVALGRRRHAVEGEEADSDTNEESGFTLIELMVVLLVMGILMAIAIPTFLGVTNTANDTSVQSNLTNAMTSAKAIYARADAWPADLVTSLNSDEPQFKFSTAASTAQSKISVKVTGTALYLAAYMTKTKVCWEIKDTQAGTVTYGYVGKTDASACSGGAAFAATGSGTKWPTGPTGK